MRSDGVLDPQLFLSGDDRNASAGKAETRGLLQVGGQHELRVRLCFQNTTN